MILIIDVIQYMSQKCNSGDMAEETTDKTRGLRGQEERMQEDQEGGIL